jgi:hypothetical protein
MPLMIEGISFNGPRQVMLLISTRLSLPIGNTVGPRMRAPRRKKIGALRMSRMVIPTTVMSSMIPPSTVSSARPRQLSKMQLLMAMFLNPPFDSVPNLMRPVRCQSWSSETSGEGLKLPSSSAPTWYPPVT